MKAIITDLDRTLQHTDKSLSDYTVRVLKKCRDNGILVMVASARPQRDMKKRVGKIDFDSMVVSNGARIICGNERCECEIPTNTVIDVLNALKQYPDLKITLETGDEAYANAVFDSYESIYCEDLISIARKETILKLIVGIEDENTVETVKKALPNELYYTVAHSHLMQIMNTSATKWNGIKQMLTSFDISPEDAVYFGDDNDDIEPIKNCGLGIAVSNAIPAVLAVADRIIDTNDNDGVAKFIEEYLLNGENDENYN